jgi:hypothetical protein
MPQKYYRTLSQHHQLKSSRTQQSIVNLVIVQQIDTNISIEVNELGDTGGGARLTDLGLIQIELCGFEVGDKQIEMEKFNTSKQQKSDKTCDPRSDICTGSLSNSVTDLTPPRMMFLAVESFDSIVDQPTNQNRKSNKTESVPISTPSPLRPTSRILEAAIRFMASWPNTYL